MGGDGGGDGQKDFRDNPESKFLQISLLLLFWLLRSWLLTSSLLTYWLLILICEEWYEQSFVNTLAGESLVLIDAAIIAETFSINETRFLS